MTKHMRRGFHAVKMADGAGVVVNPRGRGDFQIRRFLARLFRRAVAEIFRVHGIHQQPHDAFGGQILLQFLHRAGRVMVVAERAVGVVGFDDDNLALVIGQLDGLAVDVRAGEIRRGLADFHGEARRRPKPARRTKLKSFS